MDVRRIIDEQRIPDRRLGRHIEHDPASRGYAAARAPKLITTMHHRRSKPFDQGDVGSCTGNAMAGALDTAPFTHSKLSERTALKLYELATQLDGMPGTYPPDDTGSSGLAVCKAAKQLGYITAYTHAFGIDHALAALVIAPVITGISWYEGFDEPDVGDHGLITIAGGVRGGHELEVVGLDVERKRIRLCNSWAATWGDHGYCEMTWDTWAALLNDQGDVTVPHP